MQFKTIVLGSANASWSLQQLSQLASAADAIMPNNASISERNTSVRKNDAYTKKTLNTKAVIHF